MTTKVNHDDDPMDVWPAIERAGRQHTPGPWHLEPLQSDQGASIAICGPDDYGILATIAPLNAEDEPDMDSAQREPYDEANARLIAAAPDLLAACKALLALIPRGKLHPFGYTNNPQDRANDLAREAIAKAEGRVA